GYGYQWWIPKFEAQGKPVVAAMTWGNGGQCAFVFPQLDLIVVLTAGNYNQFDKDALLLPHRLVAEYVLPAAGVRGATVSVNFKPRSEQPVAQANGPKQEHCQRSATPP